MKFGLVNRLKTGYRTTTVAYSSPISPKFSYRKPSTMDEFDAVVVAHFKNWNKPAKIRLHQRGTPWCLKIGTILHSHWLAKNWNNLALSLASSKLEQSRSLIASSKLEQSRALIG